MIDLNSVLGPFLAELGAGVASSAIYDALKRYFDSGAGARRELEQALSDAIVAKGLDVRASTIIDFLAGSGVIVVTDSQIYAPQKIVFAAINGGKVWFGGDSVSKTDKTAIKSSGRGTGILASGNAAVMQNPDGSISFHVGRK